MFQILAVVAVVVALSSIVFPRLIRKLSTLGAVDTPLERSSHEHPTPRGAGVGVAGIVLVGTAAAMAFDQPVPTQVIAIALLFAALGAYEDLKGVAIAVRLVLLVSLSAGLLTAIFGTSEVWSAPLVALAGALAVGYWINVVNFMDGINGITALVVAVVLGSHLLLAWEDGAESSLIFLPAVAAASFLSFLRFNFPAAQVFLGDSGSYFAGAITAASSLLLISDGIAPLLVLAASFPYLVDSGLTLLLRAGRLERVWEPHREHAYQLLANEIGVAHVRTTSIVASLSALSFVLAWVFARAFGDSSSIAIAASSLPSVVYAMAPRALLKFRDTERRTEVA